MWNGDSPFSVRFERLFELSLNKEITVNMALSENCDSLKFRRRLHGESAQLLEELKNICHGINLDDSRDKAIWTINKKDFLLNHFISSVEALWIGFLSGSFGRLRYPQRIKVFLWLVIKNRVF